MITSFHITQTSARRFLLAWISDLPDPIFRVFRDGQRFTQTRENAIEVEVTGEDLPVFDVFDDETSVPAAVFPRRMILAWYGISGAVSYRIEEYVGGVWTQRASIVDRGQGYFLWESRVVEDVTTHQFRIIALDANGLESAAMTKAALMVRVPDPPATAWTYVNGSLTPTVTVS